MDSLTLKRHNSLWNDISHRGVYLRYNHCLKSVLIRSYFWSVFGHISRSEPVEGIQWCRCNAFYLNLLWRKLIPYRNQPTDLRSKSIDWFLYDIGLPRERVKDGLSLTNINFLAALVQIFDLPLLEHLNCQKTMNGNKLSLSFGTSLSSSSMVNFWLTLQFSRKDSLQSPHWNL